MNVEMDVEMNVEMKQIAYFCFVVGAPDTPISETGFLRQKRRPRYDIQD